MTRLPRSASVAHAAEGAKLHAPAAERNAAAIVALMGEIAPERGRALEIASGTGQHIVALAAAIPQIDWYPSDIAPERIASIDAYRREAALTNLHPARLLDATVSGWGAATGGFDMAHVTNLLHLIPTQAALTLVQEAARALRPGGRMMIYGPFLRDGVLTSPGDARFDADLRAADPAIGYQDDSWLTSVLQDAGLRLILTRDMPANNLAFVAAKEPR